MIRLRSRMAIGVVGATATAGFVCRYFESRDAAVSHFDPATGQGDADGVDGAGTVFICVPTDHPERGFDASPVRFAVKALSGRKTVVVASAVLPGITESLQRLFHRHRFLFSAPPEVEDYEAFAAPERQVLGYTSDSRDAAGALLSLLPRAPYERLLPAAEAEMAACTVRALSALQAAWCDELAALCRRLGLDHESVAEAAGSPRSPIETSAGQEAALGPMLDLASHVALEMPLLRAATGADITAGAPPIPIEKPLRIRRRQAEEEAA